MAKEWWEDAPVVENDSDNWWASAPLADDTKPEEPSKPVLISSAMDFIGDKMNAVRDFATGAAGKVTGELGQLRDEVFSGVDNVRASGSAVGVAAQAAKLQQTNDKIAELMSYGEGDSPEAQGLRKTAGFYSKRLPSMIGGMTETQADAQRGSQMTTRPVVAALSKAKTFGEAWDVFKSSPYDAIAGITATSLPNVLPALLTSVVAGPVAGIAAMGASSAITEAGSSLADFARDNGVDTTNKEAVHAFFTDRSNLANAMEYAGKRAGIISALDVISGGVASKTIAPAFKSAIARQAINMPAQMATQGALGGSGEALGQLATKGEIEWGPVLSEVVGEFGGAPAEVTAFSNDIRKSLATKKLDPSAITAPGVDSVDKAIQVAQEVTNSSGLDLARRVGAQWQALGITNPQEDLAAQKQAAQSGSITQAANNYQAILAAQQAGRQWQDIRPIGDPSSASSEINRSAPPIESTGMPTSATPSGRSQRSQNASQPNQPQALANTDVAATNTVAPAAPTNPIARTSDVELLSRVPEIGGMQASTTMPQFSYTVQPNGAVMIHGDTASIKEAFPGERTYSVKGGVLVGATRAQGVVEALGGTYRQEPVMTKEGAVAQQQREGIADQTEVVDTAEFGGKGFAIAPTTQKETVGELTRQQAAVDSLARAVSGQGESGASNIEVVGNSGTTPTAKQSIGRRVVSLVGGIAKTAFGLKTVAVTGINGYGVAHSGYAMINADDIGADGGSPNSIAALAIGVLGHEGGHVALERSADPQDKIAYENLKVAINEHLQDGVIDKQLAFENEAAARATEPGVTPKPVSRDYAHNEVIQNINGAMWLDHKFWNRLYEIDDGSTMRRVAYRFMEAATKFIKAAKGSDLDINTLVKNVEAVREIVAQTWAQKAMRNGQAISRTNIKSMMTTAPTDPVTPYKRKGQSNFEVAPDPNDLQTSSKWNALDTGRKMAISRIVADKIVEKVLAVRGAVGSIVDQFGSYLNDTNPSFALQIESGDLHQTSMDLGYVLSQDSMMNLSIEPFAGGDKVGAILINIGDKSFDEVKSIYDTMRQAVPEVGGQSFSEGRMIVLNYSDTSTSELADKIDAALVKEYDVKHREVYSSFPEKKDYDYASNTNGSGNGGLAEAAHRRRLGSLRAEATKLIEDELAKPAFKRKGRPGVVADEGVGAQVDGAIHYGKSAGLSSLSGSSNGTGIKGAEQERLKQATDPRIKKRVYFYLPTEGGIPNPESGLGQHVYSADLTKLYDPLTSKPIRGGDANAFESAVLDAGFDGYVNQSQGIAVVLNRDVPVEYLGTSDKFKKTTRAPVDTKPKVMTRTEGDELVRKPDNAEVLQIIRARDDITFAAPSFKMQFGEARVLATEAATADSVLADAGSTFQFGEPAYKRRESYDSIDDINDLGNFNLDDIDVSESDDEKLFKKFDPDAIDAGELAAKIEAELMEKMYGTTTGKVADSGALKTSDFGATLDRSIKQAGLHPENAFPDLEYKTNSDGSRTAAFKVNGVRYISEIKDGKSPSMRGPSGLDADPGDSNANGNLGGHAISHDFRGLTQEAKEAWNKRMAANGELLRRGYDIYTAVPKDARQRVADVWKSIAQNPDAFEFMKAESPTGKNYKEVALDIAKKMLGSGRYEARLGELDDSENMTHSGGFALFIKDKKTGIESRATVDYNRLEKRVVMHTHNLEKGSGAGKAVYQVGQAFATAFNAKIKADHVLLGVNNYRRTEQMFSGMLRSGNYDTMQPGIGQRIFGWNERAKTADQQERNMVRTALAITRNVEELAPDISKISYDLQSGRFYMKDRGDTTESRLMAGIIVKRILADTDVRAMSVSRSTLARAAVTLDAIEGNVEVPDHIHEPVLYSRKQRKLDERTDVAPMMDELGRALKSKTSASIDRAMGRISDWRKMLNSVNEASFQSELMGIGERAVSLAVRSGVTEQDARTVPVPTGATPHVLRMLGFDMNPMTASSRIIGKILNGKHAKDFANATPKEFIESIYHPILITNLQKPDEYEIVSNIIHPQDGSPESGFPVVFVVKRNAVFEGQVGENGKRMKSLATHSLMSAYAKPSFWTIGLRSGMKTGKLLYANVGALQELESKNPALGRVLLPRGASTNPDTQTVNPVSADSASLPSTSDDGSLRKERANVSIGSAPSGLVAPSASQLTKDIAKSVMAGSVKGYGDLVKWVSENYTGDGDEMPLYSRKHYDSQAALDAKFERMRRFHQDFDDLRQRIHDDAENGKEEAAILRLIARTGFRIGGDPSLSGNHEAFGASTLKPDHVTIDGDEIHFDFIGKAGVRQQHSIEDPVLAKDLAARLENEKLFSKADRAVRKYLDSIIDGKDYKVHDFRTWNATRAAMDVVNDLPLPVNAEEFRAAMELAGSVAASKIGDTLGVTLEHYVDPQIFDEWRESAGVKNPPRVPSSTGQSEIQSTEADDAGAGEGDNGQAVQIDLSRKQTNTPEFKRWFKDSKVVDADGKPLVLYHGTKGDFTKFGKTRIGVGSTMFGTYEVERHGIFVTPSAELANDFATQGERNKQTGANVMPLYASIQNPLDMTQGYTDSIFNAVEKWGDAKDLNGYRIARNLGDNWGDWMLFDEDTGQDPEFLINMLKELGYDGVKFYEPKVAGEGASGDTFVAFDPEQIKSAIGNNGDFDGTNPDIRYKRKEIVGQTNRQYTPEQLRAFSNVGFQVEVPTLAERAKEMWKDAGKKLTQGIADQFVPIAEFDKKAYGLMRLSKGASGAFEALLQGGKLKLTDKVYDFDADNRGGVVETLLTPLQGEHHDFLRWIAANRAERLSAEDRENLFSAEDIVAIKSLASGRTDFDYTLKHGPNAGSVTRNRSEIYNDSLKTFDAFNRNVMDMAEQSGLIDPEARAVWEHEFYVPFYRQTDEDGFVGARVKAGVVRQKAFKELKGGKDKLNADLLDNTLMNWAHLLDASAKNRAAAATLEAAEDLGIAIEAPESTLRNMSKSIGNKNGVVWVMDEGKQRFFLVDDPYVLAALNGLEYAGMKGPIMDVMSSFKHALTIGVTASPFFKVRNLIRDSVQAISVGNLSYNPVKNVVQGFKLSNRGSDDHFRLLASGGTIHFGTMYEGSEARRVQALVESGVDQGSILDSQHKVKAFYRKFIEPGITAYNELGNRGEEINRASLYDQLRKQGVSHADAALQARDLMDFSMQGSFQTVRFLTQVVPFMNARIQGMYKLGRGAKENPARFSAVLGMVALASLGLLAAYHDDDDWKQREEWDRNNFWWFKFGGNAFRIPKPFEVGAIGTLAERGFEWMFDKEMTNKRFMSQVGTLLADNLSMNPIPQAVKPILDVYSNKDSFSGRDIQSASMEKLEPQERYNAGTSMAARGASTAMSKVMGTSALSPVQIDHLLRGYFGWLGSFVVGAGDVIARPATNQPTKPTPDYWKVATGGMIADKDSGSSRYVSQMYEQAKELEMAYSTFGAIKKKGDAEATREYVKDNRDKLQRYDQVEAAKKSLSLMNERIRMIERSSMEPDKKRDMIRDLKDKEDRIARSLVPH